MNTSNTVLEDPKQNNILASFRKADYARILPDLELVEIPFGWTITEAGDHEKYVHFPISGIVSLIYVLKDGFSNEVAMIGNEGMLGVSIYLGGGSMLTSTKVQHAGKAYRLSRSLLKKEFALGLNMHRIALLYTQTLIAQTSQTAVCNKHHSKDQQFCRWLLMTIDRLSVNHVDITHLSIAKRLGIRRESISGSISKLQKEGIIACSPGHIEVVNMIKLKKRVCECYKVVTKEYRRLLPNKIKKTNAKS